MRTPAIVITDPELIKQVGVKDFDFFMNHRPFVSEDNDPMFSNILFNLQGKLLNKT